MTVDEGKDKCEAATSSGKDEKMSTDSNAKNTDVPTSLNVRLLDMPPVVWEEILSFLKSWEMCRAANKVCKTLAGVGDPDRADCLENAALLALQRLAREAFDVASRMPRGQSGQGAVRRGPLRGGCPQIPYSRLSQFLDAAQIKWRIIS